MALTLRIWTKQLNPDVHGFVSAVSSFNVNEGIEVNQPTEWVRIDAVGISLTEDKFQFKSQHANGWWEFVVWLADSDSVTVEHGGMEVQWRIEPREYSISAGGRPVTVSTSVQELLTGQRMKN